MAVIQTPVVATKAAWVELHGAATSNGTFQAKQSVVIQIKATGLPVATDNDGLTFGANERVNFSLETGESIYVRAVGTSDVTVQLFA